MGISVTKIKKFTRKQILAIDIEGPQITNSVMSAELRERVQLVNYEKAEGSGSINEYRMQTWSLQFSFCPNGMFFQCSANMGFKTSNHLEVWQEKEKMMAVRSSKGRQILLPAVLSGDS